MKMSETWQKSIKEFSKTKEMIKGRLTNHLEFREKIYDSGFIRNIM